MAPLRRVHRLVLCLFMALWPFMVKPQTSTGSGMRSRSLGTTFGERHRSLEMMAERFAMSTAFQRADRPRRQLGTAMNQNNGFKSVGTPGCKDTFDNVTDGSHALKRDMLQQRRQRRFISKRKLKKKLQECEASLQETQATLNAPSFLFIQMAQSCTLEMTAGRYYLKSSDMDIDTYMFSDKPFRYASTLPTSYFVGYLFDEIFADEKPNAGFTFNVYNNQSEASFEGPLISIVLKSQEISLQDDKTTMVVYELAQSAEQVKATPLSAFFPVIDPDGSASLTYELCSIFIDDGEESVRRSDSVTTEKNFFQPLLSVEESAKRVSFAASVVERGPPGPSPAPGGNVQPTLRRYAKVWQYKNGEGKREGGIDAKDYLKGAAGLATSASSFIEKCKSKSKGCDSRDIVSGVSNMFLSFSFVVGAAFPPVGIALTVVASVGLLISALALDSSFASVVDRTITPSIIQGEVNKALRSFTASLDVEVLASFTAFLQLDIDCYVRRIGCIGNIAKQKGAAGQQSIDKQVRSLGDKSSKKRYCVTDAESQGPVRACKCGGYSSSTCTHETCVSIPTDFFVVLARVSANMDRHISAGTFEYRCKVQYLVWLQRKWTAHQHQ